MKHVVVYDEHICPRCKIKVKGAAVEVLGHIVCTDCFYNGYQIDLEPSIKSMIAGYFGIRGGSDGLG